MYPSISPQSYYLRVNYIFTKWTLHIQKTFGLTDHREVALNGSPGEWKVVCSWDRSDLSSGLAYIRGRPHCSDDFSKFVGRQQATIRQVDITLTVPVYRYRNRARSKYSCRDIRDKKEHSHEQL